MSDILDELTAKEIAEEALGAMEFAKENPDLWVQDLEYRINQYTLSIIEKAVEEERKRLATYTDYDSETTAVISGSIESCENILSYAGHFKDHPE